MPAASSTPAGGLTPLPATPGGDSSGADAEGDGYAGSSERSTLATLAANCSHITAEAALRNATASFASARTLPLRDAWCDGPWVPRDWLAAASSRGAARILDTQAHQSACSPVCSAHKLELTLAQLTGILPLLDDRLLSRGSKHSTALHAARTTRRC